MPGPNGNGQRPPAIPTLESLQDKLKTMRDANQAQLADLQRRGIAADPMSLVHARIDILISSVAQLTGQQAPLWDVMARLAFEQHLMTEMATANTEGTRMQLAAGANFTPGMIAQLARQTGTFGLPR